MSQLAQVFNYADQAIRTVLVADEPWFVAADVCAILGIGNARMAVSRLDGDEKGVSPIDTPGGTQTMAIVSEAGLYELVVRSDKPGAKAFRRWVTHEVLPSIRRTGRYSLAVHAEQQFTIPQSYAAALQLAADQARQLEDQAQQLAVVTPRAEAWDHLASGTGDYSVADAAKILSQHPALQLGERRLFTVLDEQGWIFRQRGDGRWRVYQRAVDSGWLSELPTSHYHPRSGQLVIDPPQVRVTVKGLEALQTRLTAGQLQLESASDRRIS